VSLPGAAAAAQDRQSRSPLPIDTVPSKLIGFDPDPSEESAPCSSLSHSRIVCGWRCLPVVIGVDPLWRGTDVGTFARNCRPSEASETLRTCDSLSRCPASEGKLPRARPVLPGLCLV